jgi:hypothetical protein
MGEYTMDGERKRTENKNTVRYDISKVSFKLSGLFPDLD